ncbi:MAG: antibiotic biosynthesis monooxygenase [Deferribacteraceae bacterium]|jgi:quinol monooxygenase YgiN|nr:antibiotic biosynthesis monooxygenase [Deferribacteraceae bacterium]
MIAVVAKISVKKEKVEDYLKSAQKVTEHTRKEAGCISYEPVRSNSDPLQFAMIEKWQSKEALDAHTQTAHFQAFGSEIKDMLTEPLAIDVYTIL